MFHNSQNSSYKLKQITAINVSLVHSMLQIFGRTLNAIIQNASGLVKLYNYLNIQELPKILANQNVS